MKLTQLGTEPVALTLYLTKLTATGADPSAFSEDLVVEDEDETEAQPSGDGHSLLGLFILLVGLFS